MLQRVTVVGPPRNGSLDFLSPTLLVCFSSSILTHLTSSIDYPDRFPKFGEPSFMDFMYYMEDINSFAKEYQTLIFEAISKCRLFVQTHESSIDSYTRLRK